MEKVLDVKGLCKTYVVNKRQNNVLKNIDLTIEEGEMVSVMGPSGSGKSTLLYCISGMDRPTAGEVRFRGRELSGLNDRQLAEVRLDEMGFIFQQMYMMKNLSVLDNVILPSVRSGKNKEKRRRTEERGRELLNRLGIGDIAANDINEASGGQLQRACICRSLMNDPQVIFADEPTGALNRSTSDEVLEELLKINREGTAVVCVTHDVKVAAQCSRVLYITDGTIHSEITLGRYDGDEGSLRDRERRLSSWLMEQGW